ncbi:MAG TPA: HD domain-containing phosphohydrolase [Sedimentisphaerales bacterium]|nr:HD domain-containing phosphohydrolase [Sedimentisphaerales bacterium]
MAVKAEEHIEIISNELSHVYEELVLLHRLSTNMNIAEPDSNYLQMACDSLTDIVTVEGIAILQQSCAPEHNRLVLAAGSGLIDIDERMTTVLYTRLAEAINNGQEALLDSDVDSPFRYDWPGNIRSIIAVPLCGKEKPADDLTQTNQSSARIIGLMVAVNRIDKPDFDSTDVKLFNSVANGCAVFIENGRLFRDLKELFIGSLKALTSSIDAKDQYTRGHSERVAFVSRWIAENLANAAVIPHDQMHKAYLAGLLHDIGKMGINEAVLRKEGRLSTEELNHIRTHPSIGAAILSEIKQMHEIIPGILCHHERMDGTGYPNGLFAHQIPLLGKIVGLADSFDAMTSKRTYRGALSVDEALQEIIQLLGAQFDRQVGSVFLSSDVHKLWAAMQDGPVGVYDKGNFSEYGSAAVGALIG